MTSPAAHTAAFPGREKKKKSKENKRWRNLPVLGDSSGPVSLTKDSRDSETARHKGSNTELVSRAV